MADARVTRGQVCDQLVELLLGSGRRDEAVAIYREAFERRTIHQDYLRLRQAAERTGQWPDLRDWALDFCAAGRGPNRSICTS
jgi:uncharacterized Zn finger protein